MSWLVQRMGQQLPLEGGTALEKTFLQPLKNVARFFILVLQSMGPNTSVSCLKVNYGGI